MISLISCRVVHIISAAVLCPVLGTVLHIILTGITAAVLHAVLARVAVAVLDAILAGITAAVLSLILAGITAAVLGLILTGIAAGILAAVPLRIRRIGSVAVSAVVHITVMISHCAYLLFGFNKFVTGLVCEFERKIYRCAAVGFFQFLNTCNSCFSEFSFHINVLTRQKCTQSEKPDRGAIWLFLGSINN